MQTPNTPPSSRLRGGGFLASEPLLLIGLLILTLYFARTLLVPLAFALVLNFLLTPAVVALERLRIGRAPAVIAVILIFFSGLGVTGWVVARQLVHVAELLPAYHDNIQTKLNHFHTPIGGAAGHAFSSLQEMSEELSTQPNPVLSQMPPMLGNARQRRRERAAASATPTQAANAEPMRVQVVEPSLSASGYLRALLTPIAKPFAIAGVVMIFTIYMLMNREDLRNRLLLLAGMGRLNLMSQALHDAASRISRYLVWQFVVNVGFGAVLGIGLYALGVPDATLWGALSAILRYVPYVGTAFAGLLPVVFSIIIFPHWGTTFAIVALYAVLEFLTGNFFEPWLYGSRTGISALALLASAIFWSMLWGGAGLVLATPLTVCLIVMGRYVPQMGFLHVLLGDEAELAPEAHYYERLLAMDQAEAYAIADRALKGRTLVDFYDNVLLPALSLAESDRHKGGLDEARGEYLFLSTGELIAELSEYKQEGVPSTAHPAVTAPGSPSRVPIVCIPVGDPADELAATMLAQLLEQTGHDTLLLPTASVIPEILERLAQDASTIVCISALPPFAFTQTRTLCQRVREHLHGNRILVGLWLSQQDPAVTRERFGFHGPDCVVVHLHEAVAQIDEWQRTPAAATPLISTVANTAVSPV